jgi:hypothetical protein
MAGKVDGWRWRFENPYGRGWIVRLSSPTASYDSILVAWEDDSNFRKGEQPTVRIYFDEESKAAAKLAGGPFLFALARKDYDKDGKPRARVLLGVYRG